MAVSYFTAVNKTWCVANEPKMHLYESHDLAKHCTRSTDCPKSHYLLVHTTLGPILISVVLHTFS